MGKRKPASVPSQPALLSRFESSDALCRYISEQSGGTCLLSFSCGKDSIASWLQLRRHFTRIVPYYLYRVPGLRFVEERLAYFQDFFQSRIIRLPHPSTYRMLNNMVFQPPQNRRVIEEAGLPTFTYDQINQIIREDLGLDSRCYCASGVRAADSMARRTKVKTHGPVNHARLAFYPIYDWNKDRLISELTASGVKLPVDYKLFGVSFDGINEQFLEPIKREFPEDYRRILDFFPLAEVELARAAYRRGERYVA